MNKLFRIFTTIMGVALFTSCSKDLEKDPLERLKDDIIFDEIDKNADYAKQFLYGTYLQLPGGYNRLSDAFLESGSDDAVHSADGNTIENFRNGRITALSLPDDVWAQNYTGIRRANIFLSKVDRVPADSAWKSQSKAEARFLRAYFYFELVKRWGGVPLLGDKVYGLQDDINIKRNITDECISYILSELAAAQDRLLTGTIADGNIGRATKGAALALRARVLLYAASPLMNTANDQQKWTDAANAAKSVMDLASYSLATDFIGLFNATKNAEIIFMKEQAQSQLVETRNGPIGYVAGSGLTSPSQNLVDAFLMKNGKMITDGTSGYSASAPYTNRDPRLDATILYNGKNWLSRPLETFEGGKDKPGGNIVQTKTGYYLRKFMGKFESSGQYSNQTHHIILIRYAEILLNYAEALNEVDGPGTSIASPVYKAIIDLRKRAGITAGADNRYGLPDPATNTKDLMREIIRNERRIELAFEEHRFWDIRRWQIANTVMNAPVKGMRIVKDPVGGQLTYTVVDIAQSFFDPTKMYWYPIPFGEIQTNPNMSQNPGWSY